MSTPPEPGDPGHRPPGLRRGTGLAIGVAIGIGLGIALHSLALGISLGVAIGIAIDAGNGRSCSRRPHRKDRDD